MLAWPSPRITDAPVRRALWSATSRAWYRGAGRALLVAAVVLLIQNDEAERTERREEGRPRPDDDVNQAGSGAAPGVVALAVGQCAVQHADATGETGSETGHGLRGQRDLGYERECLPSPGEHRGYGAQVDFGLARAGSTSKSGMRQGMRRPAASRP